jgi:hypothetical protein
MALVAAAAGAATAATAALTAAERCHMPLCHVIELHKTHTIIHHYTQLY